MATISIIVPIYNVEPYLKRCVDSILNQTFTDFECILVDDGSPDNCPQICDEYAKKDKRIKVIHKENGGLSDARNAGLDIARGEYIGFVDSDDWIHPQMYEILYKAILKSNAGFISCKFERIYDINNANMSLYDETEIIETMDTYNSAEILNDFYNIYYRRIGVTVWSKLYHRNIFGSLRFKVGAIYEDEIIMIPSILLAGSVAVINEKLYFYNDISSSILRSAFSSKLYMGLDIIKYRNNFFKNNSNQYQIGKTEYYDKYVVFSIVTNLYHKEFKKEFKKYRNDFLKNIIDFLKDEHICKMYKLMMLTTFVSDKIAFNICKKYFQYIIEIVNYTK